MLCMLPGADQMRAVLQVCGDVSGGGGQYRSALGIVGETRGGRLPGRFHVLTSGSRTLCETNTTSNLTPTSSEYMTAS